MTVDVNERKFVRVMMDTAGVSEVVQVTASQRTLQTEEGSLGQVIVRNGVVVASLDASVNPRSSLLA